jgi:hypothetical protein
MGKLTAAQSRTWVVPAIDPITGQAVSVSFSHDKLMALTARSRGQVMEAARVVPAILLKPLGIFEGLCRDADEPYHGVGWRCYSGQPTVAYKEDGTACDPWDGEVFLVFVNDERVAYEWYWTKGDPNRPGWPTGHEGRFKKNLL